MPFSMREKADLFCEESEVEALCTGRYLAKLKTMIAIQKLKNLKSSPRIMTFPSFVLFWLLE